MAATKFCENFKVSKKLDVLLNLATFTVLNNNTHIILPKKSIRPNNNNIILFKK
jgi:hypothetical protein